MSRKVISAAKPETEEGLQYHIQCKPGDIAPYVLLPGDPDRTRYIANKWDTAKLVAKHREYITYTGLYKGAPISVTSTGIGGPSAAIAVEELLRVGAKVLIRVGTTGAIQPEIKVGDIIITIASVRLEGTSKQYIIPEYPAAAHYEVILALVEAAETLGVRYHLGITATTDSFYTGQARPGYKGYKQSWMATLIPDLKVARVLNFEMESATILTLANIYGVRAGCVCAVLANRITDEFEINAGVEEAVNVANESVKILYEWDEIKRIKKKNNFYPGLLKNS